MAKDLGSLKQLKLLVKIKIERSVSGEMGEYRSDQQLSELRYRVIKIDL